MNENFVVFEMNYQFLKDNPVYLHDLAELYCRIWMFDENFQEFRQCPVCHHYFSYEQVEIEKIDQCRNGHESVDLVLAWETDKVMSDILDQADSPNYYGVIAMDVRTDRVIGFSWGRLIDWGEIRANWDENIATSLHEHTPHEYVVYYDEIGVDKPYRGQDVGIEMMILVCGWMKNKYPDHLALLRTHKDSKARGMYEGLGYSIFSDDNKLSGGRVIMWANPAKNLNV